MAQAVVQEERNAKKAPRTPRTRPVQVVVRGETSESTWGQSELDKFRVQVQHRFSPHDLIPDEYRDFSKFRGYDKCMSIGEAYIELSAGQSELLVLSEDIQDPKKVAQIHNRMYPLFYTFRQPVPHKESGTLTTHNHATKRSRHPNTLDNLLRHSHPISESRHGLRRQRRYIRKSRHRRTPLLFSAHHVQYLHRRSAHGSGETTTIDWAVESTTQIFANIFM
jgi:hypothetical protein